MAGPRTRTLEGGWPRALGPLREPVMCLWGRGPQTWRLDIIAVPSSSPISPTHTWACALPYSVHSLAIPIKATGQE